MKERIIRMGRTPQRKNPFITFNRKNSWKKQWSKEWSAKEVNESLK